MLKFHIVTIFPEMFSSYLNESIIKKAIENKKIEINFYDPKKFLEKVKNSNLKKRVDDTPYGGGPGMVLRPEPFLKAIESAILKIEKENFEIIYFSPRGKIFDTEMAKKFAMLSEDNKILENKIKYFEKELKDRIKKIGEGKKKKKEREEEEKFYNEKINFIKKILEEKKNNKEIKNLIFVSGRYEGIDSRVEEIFPGIRISIGDFILTGGELPSMILIDSISRQIFGVLGNENSLEENRISSGKFFTKPAILKWPKKKSSNKKIKEYKVPEILLSGNHKKIEEWKKENS